MNHQYQIPVSRWTLIWPPLIAITQLTVITAGFTAFAEAPSFKTGWLPVTWVLLAIAYVTHGFYRFRMSTLVTIEGSSIHVQQANGKRLTSPVTVTKITEDQLNYFLDSGSWKKAGASISKKRTPPELAEALDERILLQTTNEARSSH